MNLVNKQTFIVKIYNTDILKLDTILYINEDVLGKIDEIIGNVEDPSYTVLSDAYLNEKWNNK